MPCLFSVHLLLNQSTSSCSAAIRAEHFLWISASTLPWSQLKTVLPQGTEESSLAAARSAVGITLLFHPHHIAPFSFPRAVGRLNRNQSCSLPGKPAFPDLCGQAPYAKSALYGDTKWETVWLTFVPWPPVSSFLTFAHAENINHAKGSFM